MVRELNMDTQRQNFWKEAIVKEAFVRLAWHEKYGKEVKGRDTISREERRRERAKKLTEMVPKPPTRSLTLPVIKYPKKAPPKTFFIQKGQNALDPGALLVEMRPVSPRKSSLN